jgi:hypothetical protein
MEQAMNNADDIPQSERRRIMIEERRASTYHTIAASSINDDKGGRFARTIDAAQIISNPQPSGSPWSSSPVPDEPPLGYSVEAQDPVGEKFEVEASMRSPSTPAASGIGGGLNDPPQSAPQSTRFKRRV